MSAYAMMLYALCFAALGAFLGSFAGVLAERLNTGERMLTGRSRCNSCERHLGPLDLIPLLSWLLSSGRCRTCRSRISARYTLSEAVLALLFALSYLMLGLGWPLLVLCTLLIVLTSLVLYDIAHTVVPDQLSIALFVLSLAFSALTSASLALFGVSLLVSGIIGLGFLLLHTLSGGRAMGLGDAPVSLSLSLVAGSSALPGLLFSFWIGAAVGVLLLLRGKGRYGMKSELPFVPFLAAGFLLALFTGWNPFIGMW